MVAGSIFLAGGRPTARWKSRTSDDPSAIGGGSDG